MSGPFPDLIQIVRARRTVDGRVRSVVGIFIDGQPFPYPTAGGASLNIRRDEMAGVNVTLVGERVEVVDDMFGECYEKITETIRPKPVWLLAYHSAGQHRDGQTIGIFATPEAGKETVQTGEGSTRTWAASPRRGQVTTDDLEALISYDGDDATAGYYALTPYRINH